MLPPKNPKVKLSLKYKNKKQKTQIDKTKEVKGLHINKYKTSLRKM